MNKCKEASEKHLNNPNACIKHSNNINNICKNVEDCNVNTERKISFAFDNKIVGKQNPQDVTKEK